MRALLVAVVMLAPALTLPARAVTACSLGPLTLELIAQESGFVGIVEVIEHGARENPLPTLPPDPTFTPSPTYTPETSPPTLRPFESTPVPATEGPRATHTPVDLTGIGARVRVIETYVGQLPNQVELDAATRMRVAADARRVEALDPLLVPPCEVTIGAAVFEAGRMYVVFARETGDLVYWNPVVTGSVDARHLDGTYGFTLPRAVYDGYFPPAAPDDYFDDGSQVNVITENIPVATLLDIVSDLRDGPRIAPPETGTAGLQNRSP